MKYNKKHLLKTISCLVAVLIAAGSVSALVYAKQANDKESELATTQTNNKKDNNKDTQSTSLNEKNETVYVISKANGEVEKVIVSDWLKNLLNESNILDKTQLSDVDNVKGEESPEKNGDGSIAWQSNGEDIYYQGTIQKQLPIQMHVAYYLDNQKIEPEELAGKDGTVTIKFQYENTQKKTVTIDGKEQTIYVPFAAVTGLAFDNEHVKNISVSNGKVISDGDRSIVMGFALPGMQESLGIDQSKIEFPSTIEVTADVTDFSLLGTMTVVTNEPFNQLKTDKIKEIDDLKDAATQMQDACEQLLDGSSALYDGLSTLLSKSGELVSGVNQLASGAKDLKNGMEACNDGAVTLKDGAKDLSSGLGEISSNSDMLNNGAKEVFETLLSTANAQIKQAGLSAPKLTINNYASVLNDLIAKLDSDTVYKMAYQTALKQVKNGVEAKTTDIYNSVYAEVQKKVKATVLQTQGLTEEQYGLLDAVHKKAIDDAINAQMQSDAVTNQVNGLVQKTKQDLIDQQMNSEAVKAGIKQAVESAKQGNSSLKQLREQLDRYNQFYQGLNQYTDGVDQAYNGSKQLKDGANDLCTGAAQLSEGSNKLSKGLSSLQSHSADLVNGVSKLNDGAMQLNDGMKRFKEEGVDKLIDVFDGDLKTLMDRFNAMVELSKNYKTFTDISEEMNGNVKFIYKTDSIEN